MRRAYAVAALLLSTLAVLAYLHQRADAQFPIGLLVAGLAGTLLLIGGQWIARIAEEGQEPDIADQIWRSQANLRFPAVKVKRTPASSGHPTARPGADAAWKIRALRTVANVATIASLVLVCHLLAAEPTFSDTMFSDEVNLVGLPASVVVAALSAAMAIAGRLWLERIVRSMWLPESNDRFWLSRA